MAKKKTETVEETTAAGAIETETAETEAAETQATESANEESKEVSADAQNDEKPKKAAKKAKADSSEETGNAENTSILDSVVNTVSSAVGSVAEAVVSGVETVVAAVTGDNKEESTKKTSHRSEKIGVVSSDKMTKTVTVRVDRQVKHPVYRKYVRSRKKFMAHDDFGAKVGDKVRIQETRPLSARKRWRVVEIIQKAER